MSIVATTELDESALEVVRKAQSDGEVVVTESGNVIARIIPVAATASEKGINARALDGFKKIHDELVREGKILTVEEILELRDEGQR
ncbi:MAG: hypothetical protein ABI579_00505 [Candidatus Sumerlaeota bacterium]